MSFAKDALILTGTAVTVVIGGEKLGEVGLSKIKENFSLDIPAWVEKSSTIAVAALVTMGFLCMHAYFNRTR